MKKGKLCLLPILLITLITCYTVDPEDKQKFTLTVNFYPESSGTVVQDPGDQGNGYEAGTQVMIQVFPGPDYLFLGWEGDVINPPAPPGM